MNIQGDEPLMEPEVMEKAILPFFDNPELQVSNLMTKINDPVDVVNFTVPKVITNKEGIGIYLTRSTAPYPKGSIDYAYSAGRFRKRSRLSPGHGDGSRSRLKKAYCHSGHLGPYDPVLW